MLQLHNASLVSARKLFESLAMDAEDMAPFAEKLQKQAGLKLEGMQERNTELSRTFCGDLVCGYLLSVSHIFIRSIIDI